MAFKKLKSYFVFSRKDKQAIIVLLIIIAGMIVITEYYKRRPTPAFEIITLKQLDDTIKKFEYAENKLEYPSTEFKLFYFDPNTITKEQWMQLGLKEKTANTIINYRSKGGRFYKPEDIRKIWGLKPDEANRLIPYIKLPAAIHRDYNQAKPYYNNKPRSLPTVIDINHADVNEWKILPAMNNSLAYRIINYKNKIGGFFTIEEVRVTYGMQDSIWQKILPYLSINSSALPKININTANTFEMTSHPTIFSKEVARAIVVYREQNGRYNHIEEIKNIAFINDEIFKRVSPYIVAE